VGNTPARAGTTTLAFSTRTGASWTEYAWFEQNSDFKYQKGWQKKPNPWGLMRYLRQCRGVGPGPVRPLTITNSAPGNGGIVDPLEPRLRSPYPHSGRGAAPGMTSGDGAACAPDAARTAPGKMQDPQLLRAFGISPDAPVRRFPLVRPLKCRRPSRCRSTWIKPCVERV